MSQLAVSSPSAFSPWGLVTSHYIWPELRGRSNADAGIAREFLTYQLREHPLSPPI